MEKKFTTKNLQLEVNPKLVDENKGIFSGQIFNRNVKVMMYGINKTDDDWLFKVQVHEDQWIEAFPKFTLIGIGFTKEDDGNTNLPHSCKTQQIFEHIKVNKRYASISDAVCLKAIKLLQKAAQEYEDFKLMVEVQEVARIEPLIVNSEKTDYISKKDFKNNAVIKRASKKVVFKRQFSGETFSKTAYEIYFGQLAEGIYKYKIQIYALNEQSAIDKSIRIIKHLAETGEKTVHKLNEFIAFVNTHKVEQKKLCAYW